MEASTKRVLLIRHCQSDLNAACEAIKADGGVLEELIRVRQSPHYIDAPLTEKGRLQAEALKAELENVHISKVFVSPLRRCLQTVKIVFSEHPSFPAIIVLPELTEQVKTCHGISVGSLENEYPEFDWSAMPPYHYLYDMCSLKEKDLLQERAATRSFQEVMTERIAEIYPQQWEKKRRLKKRAKKVVELLKEEFPTSRGSICVLSHRGLSRRIYQEVHGKASDITLKNGQAYDLEL
mmetsp:Transcript_8950/g.17293  ORF Transcript_8950/g.17293 Transcript_8950/m.17293 type:complete len:237 (+) Transcript_8950:50-760(+)